MGRSLVQCCQAALAFLVYFGLAATEAKRNRFVFISSPSTHNVYFSTLPSFRTLTLPMNDRPEAPAANILIDGQASGCKGNTCDEDSDRGLKSPQGLALHQGTDGAILYVSDDEAENIYAYEIAGGGGSTSRALAAASAALGAKQDTLLYGLMVGRQRLIREGVGGKVYGLATDGQGNLFYTVESGQIEMIRAEDLDGQRLTPVVLVSSANSDTVSSPAGIASDGYNVYWANQAGGGVSGSVSTAHGLTVAAPDGEIGSAKVVAANGAGALGVCFARSNVFYTSEAQSLFAVKPAGGTIAEVSRAFQQPRGCAYDGEGTIYVTDAQANLILSLPAVKNLRAVRHVTQVVRVEAPSQVTIFAATKGTLKGPALGTNDAPRSAGGGLVTFVIAVVAQSMLSFVA